MHERRDELAVTFGSDNKIYAIGNYYLIKIHCINKFPIQTVKLSRNKLKTGENKKIHHKWRPAYVNKIQQEILAESCSPRYKIFKFFSIIFFFSIRI